MKLTFNPVDCEDDAVYYISVNSAELVATIRISTTVSASIPSIQTNQPSYQDQSTTITCEGLLGYPEGVLTLQVRYVGEIEFGSLTGEDSFYSPEDECYNNATRTYTFTPTSSWNNSVLRCVTSQNGLDKTSAEMVLQLKDTVLYFSNKEYSFYIGETVQIQCDVVSFWSLTSVDIYRTDNEAEKATLSVGSTATSTINGGAITTSSTISSTDAHVELEFSNFGCKNEGQYFCRANGETTLKTSVHVNARRKPTVPPILSMNPSLVENAPLLHTCTGYVGYPAGNLVIQTYQDGEYENLNLVEENRKHNESNCSAYETLEFKNPFPLSFNNTKLRCIIQNNNTLLAGDPVPTSHEFHLLLVPANYCEGVNITATPDIHHPYDCTQYITCVSETFVVPRNCAAGNLCFGINGTGCLNCDDVDCP